MRVPVILVIFFVLSLLSNILGPLIPDIIQSFSLSLTMAAFLPFSFFLAYAVMSIPAGIFIERLGETRVLTIAFGAAFLAALALALVPRYEIALASLFAMGLGMAATQVAINPLLRVAGGEEHFAFNSVLAQFVFGLASFVSPQIYSRFVTGHALPWVDPSMPWLSMYWLFAAVILGVMILLFVVRFARVERKDDERVEAWTVHRELLRRPLIWLYVLAIFAYVSLEQGLANWMSQFLALHHGLNPQTEGAEIVSYFWGLMTVGCAVGLVLLKFIDSRRVLMAFSIASFVSLSLALFAHREISPWAFAACGFTISVMWSILFSLALNSLPDHHGTFSGLLCTGIVGGALGPLMVGWLGDRFGLTMGMSLLYFPLLYILFVGVWSQPLVSNLTLKSEGDRQQWPDLEATEKA